MSLEAPDASRRRSRSKSPGRRDRDRSPARGHSPNPYGDRDHKYEYVEPKQDRPSASKTGAQHTPPVHDYEYAQAKLEAQATTRVHEYEYEQAKQDLVQARREHPPPPHGQEPPRERATSPYRPHAYAAPSPPLPGQGGQPGYGGYAGPQPYPPPGPPQALQQVPPSGPPGAYPRANEPGQGPSGDRSYYAVPGAYQYAPSEERGARAPPSPRPEHQRRVSFGASGNFNVGLSTSPGPPAQIPPYATSPTYGYAQPPPVQHGGPPPGAHASGRYAVVHQGPPAGANVPEYGRPAGYQYAQSDQRVGYSYKPPVEYVPDRPDEKANVVEVRPGGGGALMGPPSPNLGPRMHRLSVSGGASLTGSLGPVGVPPGSPLLEAYHGTYQSMSPMPSPLMLPAGGDDDLSDITPLSGPGSSDDEEMGVGVYVEKKAKKHRKKKRVQFYDPEQDAKALVEALRHRSITIDPLIAILPRLTHENVMELRTEYKKYAKTQGKGINVAKHIKLKLGTGPFGKVCYVTALGQWESEAYWANFWYQTNTTRRELLIESLMGRTNDEIRKIKEAFRDKRYGDSLEKCMKAELKADKFRVAVLQVLEEKRQEESKYVYADVVREDVRRLHDALVAREGGETAMIYIVVTRSDMHMREVLKVYEEKYRKNFAKEMLKKSTNLVGETLAHILNGIINRPLRDALLLHQALQLESSHKERTDLLISRLVRYHWDRTHLERIKNEYRDRYGKELATAVGQSVKGEFAEFCIELCLKR